MTGRVVKEIISKLLNKLFGTPQNSCVQEIKISKIHICSHYPFKIQDDERMNMLVDSIKEEGILKPVIVRPDQKGGYELISGYRRIHAAGIVGLQKVPAIVKEMSDDEVIVLLKESYRL